MLGIVADESAEFRFCLKDAPRNLRELSREHRHGWGLAVYERTRGWGVVKQPLCAGEDPRFMEMAGGSQGDVLVAHVRKRTVGPISVENTHPFESDGWVFAHNGTIEEVDRLRAGTSPERLAGVKGSTDSEMFFAFLLTHLDSVQGGGGAEVDAALTRALSSVATRPTFGACNFILSNGDVLYAFRQGRTLHVLERDPSDDEMSRRISSETGAIVDTPWTTRRRAILVASEEMTDEPWKAVPEGTLLKVTRRPRPEVFILATL